MELTYRRTWLFGVLVACPFYKPLESCPFSYLRYNPRIIQLEYIENLPDEEVEQLIRHHKECVLQRIKVNFAE